MIDSDDYFPWSENGYADEEKVGTIEAEYLLNTERGPLVSTTFMEEYMQDLIDFWLQIFGFPQSSPRFKPGCCLRAQGLPQVVELPRDATHAFINVDASLWAVICDDEGELSAIARSWPNSEYCPVEILPKS